MESFTGRLLERDLLTEVDLARAEEVRARSGGRLPLTLSRLGLVSESDIAEALAEAQGLPLLSGENLPPEAVRIDAINPRFLRRHSLVPLHVDDRRLVVAMADPSDEDALRGITFAAGKMEIVPVVATYSDVGTLIGPATENEPIEEGAPVALGEVEDLERLAEGESEAPIIRMVQRLLGGAVDRRASDVHIEPMARHLSVRYRIDGRLVEVERHPDKISAPLASRIKVMAALDIAETRLPQDGRLRVTVRGRDVDVRVSTSPITYGESIVLRLLGRSEVPLDLEKLGLPAAALDRLKHSLDRPHGIILLTGPTGSGKTTTLYAAINRLRRPEVKILTVEDPVEVLLEGINQVQVRPEIDLSYAAALKAFLRQDPDILMIGEIRDRETAEIALRAALTGHLVLSTLHTNSAVGAFTRLFDIGIEPYLAASTVVATVAQRLIRAICTDCAVERPATDAERELYRSLAMAGPDRMVSPQGCSRCGGTGYSGRIPLIEIVEVDDALRDRVRAANVEDFVPPHKPEESLLGHGLMLARAGRTTIDEVQRAVQLG